MKNKHFENLDLNEMEETIDEYERIIDQLMDLAKTTEYIDIEYLTDCIRDEYMDDIEEMKDIVSEAENGSVPSAYEDYYDNVIVPTMRGLR